MPAYTSLAILLILTLGCLFGCTAMPPTPIDTGLIRHGDLTALNGADLPASWTIWKPQWEHAACEVRATPGGLLMDSSREPFAVGGVTQTITGIAPGQSYCVEAVAELRGIAQPMRSAMVRLHFTKAGQTLHPAGFLVQGPVLDGARAVFADVFDAPLDADGATLSLELKWPQGGSVLWKHAKVLRAPAAQRRPNPKVGVVYLRPKNSTPAKNLDLWCQKIDQAGKLGVDIVCLSESILAVGATNDFGKLAEPIPGPSTQRLGEAAKRNGLWVVAGLTERAGDRLYNTAVLIDRQGRLAGTYRKVHLPREEWQKGITPGSDYPVFQTDFGVVGILICYDWFFPEPWTILAQKGARIVFAPTWGDTLPDQDGRAQGETTFRVRARDNGLYVAASVYDGQSMVIDPLGRVLTSNKGQEGVFWAEVDLSKRERLPWVGHWRDIGPRDRMPRTYGPLVE